MFQMPKLRPGEVDDFGINFARRMNGETGTAYAWYVPAGISAVQSASGSASISLRLSGQTAGVYIISGYLSTSSGRRLGDHIEVHVG